MIREIVNENADRSPYRKRTPPEPVGQVVAGFGPLEVGGVFCGLLSPGGLVCPDQPFRVLREATREEWIAENPQRRHHPAHEKVTSFYLVSTD